MSKLQYYKDYEIVQFQQLATQRESDKLDDLMYERMFCYDPFQSQLINIEIECLIDRIKLHSIK